MHDRADGVYVVAVHGLLAQTPLSYLGQSITFSCSCVLWLLAQLYGSIVYSTARLRWRHFRGAVRIQEHRIVSICVRPGRCDRPALKHAAQTEVTSVHWRHVSCMHAVLCVLNSIEMDQHAAITSGGGGAVTRGE